MRRRHLFWIAAWLAITTSACTTLRPSQPSIAKACAEWLWIGISKPEAQCPEIPGWTVKPLFPQLSSVKTLAGDYCAKNDDLEKVPSLTLIRELNRFCVYEADHWRELLHHPPPPPVSAELVRVDQDCAALSPSGEPDPTINTWKPDSERFLAQAGLPSEPFEVRNPSGVRLAFLDTQPNSAGIPPESGNSPHGYTLLHVARNLVCNRKGCAAQITSRLALPILSFNAKHRKHSQIDTEHGGYLGLQSQLAEAILAEVRAWHDRPPQVRERRLVLNLSLAWDGELFGGLNDEEVADMRAGTQAVYRALQYANELDVLVLAAAGNQKRAPCLGDGPLLPAAWEKGILREESCGEPRSTPLLYAVGGIESEGRPLLNARPGGMPRRVAYGENAVVACPDQQKHTATLTGSSVSTAVVSSVATVVWSFFPELKPYEVMEILDGSGEELHGFQTNFWFNGIANRPVVHRISLCTALKEACARFPSNTSCPIIKGPCATWGPESLTASSYSQSRILGRDSCNPWLYPQPDDPPCPNCTSTPPPRQN